ncbi:GNAT family N-acetyltransferase [Streptomyces mirabilis]|uniref:GNAT family N-acetyltransferase n=1 Tax=Streptomyces mirabilis TaxID=68239 RepID=UPI0036B66D95
MVRSTVVPPTAGRETFGPGGNERLLTAPGERGRGLARRVASAAVAQALDDGLLPQWRARPMASRNVARALGFRELGSQLSLRLDQEELRLEG